MHSQNHIGVKKAYIDSPFDDDGPEERKPFANLIEALLPIRPPLLSSFPIRMRPPKKVPTVKTTHGA